MPRGASPAGEAGAAGVRDSGCTMPRAEGAGDWHGAACSLSSLFGCIGDGGAGCVLPAVAWEGLPLLITPIQMLTSASGTDTPSLSNSGRLRPTGRRGPPPPGRSGEWRGCLSGGSAPQVRGSEGHLRGASFWMRGAPVPSHPGRAGCVCVCVETLPREGAAGWARRLLRRAGCARGRHL